MLLYKNRCTDIFCHLWHKFPKWASFWSITSKESQKSSANDLRISGCFCAGNRISVVFLTFFLTYAGCNPFQFQWCKTCEIKAVPFFKCFQLGMKATDGRNFLCDTHAALCMDSETSKAVEGYHFIKRGMLALLLSLGRKMNWKLSLSSVQLEVKQRLSSCVQNTEYSYFTSNFLLVLLLFWKLKTLNHW